MSDKTIYEQRIELEKELEELQDEFYFKKRGRMAALDRLRVKCESQGHVSIIDPDDYGISRCHKCGVYF